MKNQLNRIYYQLRDDIFDMWTTLIYEHIEENCPEALDKFDVSNEGLHQSFSYTFESYNPHDPYAFDKLEKDSIDTAENIIADFERKKTGDE